MKIAQILSYGFGVSLLSVLWCFPYANAATPTLIYTAPQQGGTAGIFVVQLFPNHEHPTPGPCVAQLGDTIELRVDRLVDWLNELKQKNIISSNKTGDDFVNEQVPRLCLFINNQPMRTLQAAGWLKDDKTWAGHEKLTEEQKDVPRHWLRFTLMRDPSNKDNRADWEDVLKTPGFTPQMDLTIGYYHAEQNTAEALTSWIERNKKEPEYQFKFRRMEWDAWSICGLMLLGPALVIFTFLAFLSGIIREPALPVREDDLPPVSLGRCQMAFWFFLVAGAFFFLWLITGRGDTDTINSTVLTLIGISAGTALGAAMITNNTADPVAATAQPARNYPKEIATAKERLRAARADRTGVGPNDPIIAQKDIAVEAAAGAVYNLKREFGAWRRQHWNQWFLDLLSENDDTSKRQIISFHRFQIVVWTLVLGVVFLSEVLTKLAMPTFDSTLLILMGISSGTYLGFKFPTTNKP